MKREALIRELRELARKEKTFFEVKPERGNGSHYKVYFGERETYIKSGEISPIFAKIIKKQLGIK